jgi:DNA-binding NarL/FixJ family response regulator
MAGMSPTIRVLLIDDDPLVRAGLRMILSSAEDLAVVGEAADGAQAAQAVREHRPDVVLMDIRMPVMDGLEATRRLAGGPKILILTTFDLDDYVYRALRAGASGFLLKDTTPEQLLDAIRIVADGGALIAPAVTRRLIAEFATRPGTGTANRQVADLLTPREIEVLGLVGRGLTNAEIAERLVLSRLTAKTHVSRILTKLGLRDRSQLVIAAYESGLLVPGSGPS